MIRIVVENVVLFFLPAALYVAYVMFARGVTGKSALDTAPVLWLLIAGTSLVVLFLVSFGSTTGGKPGQTYIPPSYQDGKILPGRFE
jgi:Family of unknown function (DUF6111)